MKAAAHCPLSIKLKSSLNNSGSVTDEEVNSVEDDTEHKVEEQYGDERQDEGACCRFADAFGAGIAVEPLVATNQSDGAAEEHALEHSGKNIE